MKRRTAAAYVFAMATSAAIVGPAAAQQPATQAGAPAKVARAADVASVDAILAALYGTISGAAGEPRDWDRLRALFAPHGRLTAMRALPDGSFAARVLTVDDYITGNSKNFATRGFYETELARTSETFGQIANVFSTYESRSAPSDAKPFQRGINSIQLYNDGQRWWIASLLWRAEDASLALPERYLKSH